MIVYRLENESGDGIYQSRVAWDICLDIGDQSLMSNNPNHPSPWDDSLLVDNGWRGHSTRSFGFVSEEQFRAWFYSDAFLEAAARRGFALAMYSVSEKFVIVGHTQCVFDKEFATMIPEFQENTEHTLKVSG